KFGGRWICLRIKSHTSWTPPSNPRYNEYNQDMTRINKIARGARSMAEVIQVMSLK
ncbi:hypothetical protein ACJX0J_006621, partial [Zea mays]